MKKMKKAVLILLLPLFLGACQELDKFTQFELEYLASVTVQASTGINLPFNLFAPDITTNSEQEFAIHDTRKDLIELIYLKELALTLTSPSSSDFSFLEEISIYINADGLPEIEIAWKKPVPGTTGKTLVLDVSRADIQEYIKKDKFSLRLRTVTDEFLATDHTFDLKAIFFVDAD